MSKEIITIRCRNCNEEVRCKSILRKSCARCMAKRDAARKAQRREQFGASPTGKTLFEVVRIASQDDDYLLHRRLILGELKQFEPAAGTVVESVYKRGNYMYFTGQSFVEYPGYKPDPAPKSTARVYTAQTGWHERPITAAGITPGGE